MTNSWSTSKTTIEENLLTYREPVVQSLEEQFAIMSTLVEG